MSHLTCCKKKGVRSQNNEKKKHQQTVINVVSFLTAPLGGILSTVIWLLLKVRNVFPFPITAIYYWWLLKATCTAESQDGRYSAFLLIFISVRKHLFHDRQSWPGVIGTPSAFVHPFHFKWNIRSQQHFKTQFTNNWQKRWSQKAASASLPLLQHSDISSQNNQSSCSLSLHLPFKDVFCLHFSFSHWKKDSLQINNTRILEK